MFCIIFLNSFSPSQHISISETYFFVSGMKLSFKRKVKLKMLRIYYLQMNFNILPLLFSFKWFEFLTLKLVFKDWSYKFTLVCNSSSHHLCAYVCLSDRSSPLMCIFLILNLFRKMSCIFCEKLHVWEKSASSRVRGPSQLFFGKKWLTCQKLVKIWIAENLVSWYELFLILICSTNVLHLFSIFVNTWPI